MSTEISQNTTSMHGNRSGGHDQVDASTAQQFIRPSASFVPLSIASSVPTGCSFVRSAQDPGEDWSSILAWCASTRSSSSRRRSTINTISAVSCCLPAAGGNHLPGNLSFANYLLYVCLLRLYILHVAPLQLHYHRLNLVLSLLGSFCAGSLHLSTPLGLLIMLWVCSSRIPLPSSPAACQYLDVRHLPRRRQRWSVSCCLCGWHRSILGAT